MTRVAATADLQFVRVCKTADAHASKNSRSEKPTTTTSIKTTQPSRRLAAIMFNDIAGYTAMMGHDEAKALRILERNRDLLNSALQKFDGRMLKEMGDGSLSSFQSVVDAVNCAVEIQNALKDDAELKLRIALHIGDVVFTENDVFGDGVNVASRIHTLAEPGGICISERVYADIRNQP